jgi:hypothetical protein
MWSLRDGRVFRVDLEIDPCWNSKDIWKARNLFLRFKSLGYSDLDSSNYASVAVWKTKWDGTKYSKTVEKTLTVISQIS